MDRRLKIYLDTSVPNFLFADDSPEKREVTEDFFENFIKPSVYRVFISPIVLAEVEDTKDIGKRQRLLNIFEKYPIELLNISESDEKEIQELADKYIEAGIIPEKKIADALRIAVSVLPDMDYQVSWNYKHWQM
ncbi:MAG: PIN domain-containing protein [Bacteroidales bacterium]|jgi:predicted nucleic acid-binding protein|nr:PIN domain-containing protein [Bacteroidales bacterium]